MPISRRRSCAICASASLSICMSTCTEADTCSKVGSPGLRWEPDRRWRCCHPRMPPATSSKWYSGCRSESTSKDTTRTKIRLFIGTSVVPYVYLNKPPTGPDAGKFLQTYRPRSPTVGPSPELGWCRQMTDAALSPSRASAAANPWLVAAVVVVPTFMEVLDTTIAVVALRYIAGGLSATVDDGEWVLTSYLAANAIILPITGWLSAHLGRRNYFLMSIAVFTLSSAIVWNGGQSRSAHPVPHHSGSGGRRSAAQQPSRSAGRLPAGKAGRGDDAVRLGGPARAGRRSDTRWLADGPVPVAMGLFDQCACRSPGTWRMLCRFSATRNIS